ncbi:MAG TPA: hypothetical protein VNN79_14215, partial [Actinomycetota bacterium]|nr:hypothetical protein [Actinomycetota bacterium]
MDDLKERLTALGARRSPPDDLLDRTLARFDERRRHRRIGGALAGIAAMLVLVAVLAVILTNREPSVPTFSRYHDPSGWSVDVPPGWTSQPFRFESISAGAEGVQISNVPLPDPKLPPGAWPAADQQALPADGVSIVVAPQVPPSIWMDGAVDLPMDFPGGWAEASISGALQPDLYETAFRGGEVTFIATVTIGVQASEVDRSTLREIVRSIRFDGLPTPNTNETASTSSPPVTASPAPEPELRREHDPFGWSVGVPAGWRSRQFGFASGSVSAEGIQISNVELPEPGLV